MTKLNVGDYLLTKTSTKDDVFGTVVWEILEVGLPAPEKGRTMKDGIRCRMLGGTGPSARPEYPGQDSEWRVNQDIAEGITKIIPREQALKMSKEFESKKTGEGKVTGGCIEID